jgi:hypothetical protein
VLPLFEDGYKEISVENGIKHSTWHFFDPNNRTTKNPLSDAIDQWSSDRELLRKVTFTDWPLDEREARHWRAWQTTSRANELERDAEVARDGAVRPATSSR